MPHWIDHVEGLERFVSKSEFPRLFKMLHSDEEPPLAPGHKTRKELDALILSVFALNTTEEEKAHVKALDNAFSATGRHGLLRPDQLFDFSDLEV